MRGGASVDVKGVLKDVPSFDTFCSVRKLNKLVEALSYDERFKVATLGASANGEPIYHVRAGKGRVKALLVGGAHSYEPIGGLTVYSLMSLLQQGHVGLLGADVEWHIVPCIDPDGAILNEGWTQQRVTLERFMRNCYLQAPQDQVDVSFPLTHKKVRWNTPSLEATILKGLLEEVLPDFYFSLHHAWTGGVWYGISRDIHHDYHQQLYQLLERHGLPVHRRPMYREVAAQFGDGIIELMTVKKYYDYLEQTTPNPEDLVTYGAQSWDYLAEIKPSALSLIAEMGFVRHPADESEKETGQSLRKFKLRTEADSKFLATLLLGEWEKVKDDVDRASPFYRTVVNGWAMPSKEKLCDGPMPLTRHPTRDILFNPRYNRMMTESDLFNAAIVDGGFLYLFISYQFVRLLKASPQTTSIREAIERLEIAFEEALSDIKRHIDFDQFSVVNYDALARVQLGSGLIVLNSMLENR